MDQTFERLDPRRLSRKRTIQIAEQLSRSYALLNADFPANYFTINFELVYDLLIYPRFGILLEEGDDLGQSDSEKILGYYDAITNTIALDAVLNDKSDPLRWKKAFTFWHELGHAILHGEWLRTHPGQYENARIVTVESAISASTAQKLEQQANLFASRAAAPQWFLDFVLESTFRLTRPFRYVGPATYWLDVWGCRKLCHVNTFQELCRDIAYQIRHRFGGLSIEALSYRVQESDWVIDVTDHIRRGHSLFRILRTLPAPVGGVLATA